MHMPHNHGRTTGWSGGFGSCTTTPHDATLGVVELRSPVYIHRSLRQHWSAPTFNCLLTRSPPLFRHD
jgi:hypothetical protein